MERVIMTKKGNDALREELKLLKSEERSQDHQSNCKS